MAHLSLQPLVAGIFGDEPVRVTVAQGATSEIYVGCSNGELLRFSLQADAFYALVSRQTVAAGKPIDDIVILSSHHRAFIQSGYYPVTTFVRPSQSLQMANSIFTQSRRSTPFSDPFATSSPLPLTISTSSDPHPIPSTFAS
jgi:hypothetical protein